nr:hypothetical protein [Thiohalocapsa halophila]
MPAATDFQSNLHLDLPDIAAVQILNPAVDPSELTGKYIVLDVLAQDASGHCYNEMRDERLPSISLGNILQMNLVELTKADRLGHTSGPLRAWITFFKHWQEELLMAQFTHEPVEQAMDRLRELSADEETRRLAFVRARALHDEVSLLNDAERRGLEKGRREVARNLIAMQLLTDEQIATATGLTEAQIKALRAS